MLIVLLLLNSSKAEEAEKKSSLLPKHYVLQYAGNIGVVSIGFGSKIITDRIFVGFLYGYLPKYKNDVEVHTLTLKSGYVFREKKFKDRLRYAAYCGTGISYSITHNTFIKLPEHFPDGYYKPNAVHLLPFVGAQVAYKYKEAKGDYIGIYFELGTSDDHLYNYFINKNENRKSLINFAAGVVIDV